MNSKTGRLKQAIKTVKRKIDHYSEPIFSLSIVFVIFLLIFLYLSLITNDPQNKDFVLAFLGIVPTLLLFLVTWIYVRLTKNLVKTNQDLVDAQSQPSMIAQVKESDIDFHYIDLIFENVGMGIARNIQFNVKPPGFITQSGDPLEALPVIQNGIPTLGPKQKFRLVLCFLPDKMPKGVPLSELHDSLKFTITITYQNSHGDNKGPEQYDIDLGIFWGIRYLQQIPQTHVCVTDSSGNVQFIPAIVLKENQPPDKI